MSIKVSDGEVLGCDWNKYSPHLIASCGATTDPRIKLWDLRNTSTPVSVMGGHKFGVRRILWSPHDGNSLVSCS